MIGRIAILKARSHSTTSLGKDFNLKDFHYQVNLHLLNLDTGACVVSDLRDQGQLRIQTLSYGGGPIFFFLLALPTLPPPAVFSQNIGGPRPRAPPLDSPLPKEVDEDFMCNYVCACVRALLCFWRLITGWRRGGLECLHLLCRYFNVNFPFLS